MRGLRVLNVDPPVFAIPDFSGAEADALAKLAKGGTKLVRNAKTVDLSAKLPAPMGENMPALAPGSASSWRMRKSSCGATARGSRAPI